MLPEPSLAARNRRSLRLPELVDRRPDLQVRSALGQSRARLLGQLTLETALLSIGGALGGVTLALVLTPIAERRLHAAGQFAYWIDADLDWRVLAAAVGFALLGTFLGGLLPALWMAGPQLSLSLRAAAVGRAVGGSNRLTQALVALQVGLCLALLLAAGVTLKSTSALLALSPGFDGERLMVAALSPVNAQDTRGVSAMGRRNRLVRELEPRLEARPDIEVATFATRWPSPRGSVWAFRVRVFEGVEDERLPTAAVNGVVPGFFRDLGIPLLMGRELEPGDEDSPQPAVVVSSSLARRHFEGSPLGQPIELVGYSLAGGDLTGTVVGIVADVGAVRPGLPQPENPHLVYVPFAQARLLGGLAFVRGRGGLEVLSPALSEELKLVEPLATAYDSEMYDDRRARTLWIERQLRTLGVILGAVALLFTAGSLYSLVALLVERRAAELALRSALGATPHDLRSIVLAFAGRALALGLILGALFSLALGRAVR